MIALCMILFRGGGPKKTKTCTYIHKVLIMFLNVHLYQQITISGREFFQWRRHSCVFLFVVDETMVLIGEANMFYFLLFLYGSMTQSERMHFL